MAQTFLPVSLPLATSGAAPLAFNAATTYQEGQLCLYAGQVWLSVQFSNTGNTPVTGSAYWQLMGLATVPAATGSSLGGVQLPTNATSTTLSKAALSGDYHDLINTPTLPSPAEATSSVPGLVLLANGQSNPQLAAVANTGSYHDLLDPPTINNSGTLIANMVSFALVFATGSTQTVTHNLNTLTPLVTALVNNGCQFYQITPVDPNTVRVTAFARGSITLQFQQNGGTQTVNLPPVAIPTSGLVDYWPLSDGTGTTALNQVDSSRNLQLTGTSWASDVDFGTGIALHYDGATPSNWPSGGGTAPNEKAIAAGVSSSFACNNFASGNYFSISFWVKMAAYPTAPGIPTGGFADFLGNGYLYLAINGVGNLHTDMLDSSGNVIGEADTSFQVAPLNTIAHVCMVYTGTGQITGINYYVNGQAQPNNYGPNTNNTASAPPSGAATNPWSAQVRLNLDGHSLPNGNFSGIAIYNRQLSATEVNQIFLQGAP